MILSKHSKLLFLAVFLFSSYVQATVNIAVQQSSYNISNETSSGKSESSSSASEVFASYNYFFTSKVSVEPLLFASFSGDFYTTGFGLNGRYYFQGGKIPKLNSFETKIKIRPIWSSYLGLGLQRVSLSADTVNIAFFGYAVELGTERYISKNLSIFLRAGIKSLISNESRSLSGTNLLLGLSYDI